MNPCVTPESVLAALLKKYSLHAPFPWHLGGSPGLNKEDLCFLSGDRLGLEGPQINDIPLFPWRYERRFLEMRQLREDGVVSGLSTLKSYRHVPASSGLDLAGVMFREMDLAEWLGGAPLKAVYGVVNGDAAANLILRLANGVRAVLELSVTPMPLIEALDRHELIAARGVACDRVVDTQVPQSSVYAFTREGIETFTDVDFECFGLSAENVALVRSAFRVFTAMDSIPDLCENASRLWRGVRLALASAKQGRLLNVETAA